MTVQTSTWESGDSLNLQKKTVVPYTGNIIHTWNDKYTDNIENKLATEQQTSTDTQ